MAAHSDRRNRKSLLRDLFAELTPERQAVELEVLTEIARLARKVPAEIKAASQAPLMTGGSEVSQAPDAVQRDTKSAESITAAGETLSSGDGPAAVQPNE